MGVSSCVATRVCSRADAAVREPYGLALRVGVGARHPGSGTSAPAIARRTDGLGPLAALAVEGRGIQAVGVLRARLADGGLTRLARGAARLRAVERRGAIGGGQGAVVHVGVARVMAV